MPYRTIPIILYHKIGINSNAEDPFRLGISIEKFERQMRYLHDNGYTTVRLGDVLGGRAPNKSLILTFDDGSADNFSVAYPVLRRYRFTATFFLVTDFIGKRVNWPSANSPTDFMTWEQIKEMCCDGMSIGSHTCTHASLTELPLERAVWELRQSKMILEDRLGQVIEFFAYPGGHQNATLQDQMRACGYQGACGVDIGDPSPFNLWRIQIHTADSMAMFHLKASGWFDWLKRVRKHSRFTWFLTEFIGRGLNWARLAY